MKLSSQMYTCEFVHCLSPGTSAMNRERMDFFRILVLRLDIFFVRYAAATAINVLFYPQSADIKCG